MSRSSLTFACVIFFAIGLLSGHCCGDEKPLPRTPAPDASPKIIIPIIPVLDEVDVPEEDHPSPPPRPHRGPVPVTELSEDTWYVIESSVPLIVISSPTGHVAVQADEGPVRVRGKFADGTGKTETRTFSSKHLYFINALKPGSIELLVIPAGVLTEADILRQTLTVMGQSPQPPPDPKPEPKPDPDPTPTPASDKICIEIVEDTLNMKPDTAIVLNAVAKWNEFKDQGHDWRIYDKTTGEPKGLQAVKDAAGTPLPAMVVRDIKTGKVIRVLTLPLTMDSVKRVISELTGGV